MPEIALRLQRAAGNRAVSGVLQRAPERDAPAYAPARTEQREAFLKQAAGEARLPRDDGLRLWELAGGERNDPVSRLGAEGEQGATLASAAAHAQTRQLPGFRLTVSLRNLSGLNERLGHSGADAFYASAAEILDRRLHALDADVNGFRSQGTMTFAVVARSGRTGASTLRTSILEAMRDAEVHVRGVAGGYALGKLPSPRGGAQGTGLQFDEKTDLVPLETAPATEDGARRPEPVRPSRGPSAGGFEAEPELRHRRFVAAAEQLRLTPEQAEELWRAAGGEASDALTGFGAAGDRLPTVERASALARSGKRHAFYVEVDVRNLSGLNAVSRTEADRLFGEMTQIAEAHVRTLTADVVPFRHGGDEFSFVVVTPDASAEAAVAERALTAALGAAEAEIAKATREFADIPHPKHRGDPRYNGTGITWGVASLGDPGLRTAADAVRAADSQVEVKKQARTG
jgi:GGDEF domain-containing protein